MDIKHKLHLLCNDYIAKSVANIKQNVAEAQEAAGEDTKSSAGDKYEVGREMMQQEIELNLARLGDMVKLKHALEDIDPTQKSTHVAPGSLVITNTGKYYISIGAGKLNLDGTIYYAVSPEAPIAQQMMGKSVGDSFELNGKKMSITEIH